MIDSGPLTIAERSPTLEEYQVLRTSVGWPVVDDETASIGLSHSLFSVCAIARDRTIGCGRVVGDAGLYLYVQDIIVLPEFQRRGVGRAIMTHIMDFIARTARANTFVGLMAARGVAGYYREYGFVERPVDRPGMYLMWPAPQSGTGRNA